MASQTSKGVLTSLIQSEFLVVSTRAQKATVTAELEKAFHGIPTGVDGEGARAPDWDNLQESHAALLERSAQEVREADQEYRQNLVQASQLRRERREQVDLLRQNHRDLRTSFTGTYGKEGLPFVGLDAPPLGGTLALREQCREVIDRMRDEEMTSRLPDPKAGQKPLEPGELADNMETEVVTLEGMMDPIRAARKRVEESRIVKNETLKRHRRIYLSVARIQENYYLLAGLEELAKKIRETIRKSPSVRSTDSEVSAPAEAPPTEAPPTKTPESSPEETR